MTQHTPGPWQRAIVDHGDQKQVETIHAPNVQFDRTPFPVVQPGGIWGRSFEECDANARLIAAAPELLAALRELLAYANMYSDQMALRYGHGSEQLGSAADSVSVAGKARAAIAKAAGET